jgi:hypothetical protein
MTTRPARVRRGILRSMLAAAAILCGTMAGLPAPGATSPGTGFTGDYWYRLVGGEFTVPCGGCSENAAQHHSYGFNSATNISQSANGFVRAQVYNLSNAGVLAATADGYNLARACVHGTFPNCVDTDGWTGSAWIFNRSNVNLRLKGHGVY